ncbi:MAG: hypothetical protein DMG41_16330 [Acidobacteria bacterium]|nr:MAG: hypothetical protein DMG41_16330 [Acidobacteriota bacterium]
MQLPGRWIAHNRQLISSRFAAVLLSSALQLHYHPIFRVRVAVVDHVDSQLLRAIIVRQNAVRETTGREKEGLPSHRHIDTFGRSTVVRDTAIGISEQAINVIAEDAIFDSFHGANSQYLTSAHTSGTPDKTANAKVERR